MSLSAAGLKGVGSARNFSVETFSNAPTEYKQVSDRYSQQPFNIGRKKYADGGNYKEWEYLHHELEAKADWNPTSSLRHSKFSSGFYRRRDIGQDEVRQANQHRKETLKESLSPKRRERLSTLTAHNLSPSYPIHTYPVPNASAVNLPRVSKRGRKHFETADFTRPSLPLPHSAGSTHLGLLKQSSTIPLRSSAQEYRATVIAREGRSNDVATSGVGACLRHE
mmetsp:Transcript_15189/g.38367  ORF Transcript_15189/g.38367 Transcript_15189/m.38367 type:complete len:223 (+) Transcript_15189:263-931(+)|eukprot:CAMPEP_0113887932 /NCGR_PEP_ID=MMETSP0780_2-20120614/12536_1 /TAXON_ID=652834 /ORGANISM="Palpitomonas bilix" /LENGTH=222 /DNA_ID=CAMNT_0000876615 /DNA_START=157 /DNA_END=825 /DNA_ORIENTATION=+ /assembly_acc=CAM_ASM_000599